MDEFYQLAKNRRSIRKFKPIPIPDEDIYRFIEAAVSAPSGCNSQCWHFLAIKNPEAIAKLAEAVEQGAEVFYQGGFTPAEEGFVAQKKKALTFFRNAPLVIAVFLTHLDYYDPRVTALYSANGFSHRQMMDNIGYPDVLSIGAAVENMLLEIENMGYGACWMNDPVIAERGIKQLLEVDDSYRLLSLIPVGVPSYTPREKVMKPMNEVLKIIK